MSTVYTGLSGMLANEMCLNTTGNNIANSVTNGYKSDQTTERVFEEVILNRIDDTGRTPLGSYHHQVFTDEVHTDYSQGFPQMTNKPLDIFIDDLNGEAVTFITVERNGEELLIRNGHLKLDVDHNLVSNGNLYTLNNNGERINLSGYNMNEITINGQGQILDTITGDVIDEIAMSSVSGDTLDTLKKVGNNSFAFTDETEFIEASFNIYQGFLESSNVNLNKEMIDLMTAQKGYSMNAKTFQTADSIREIESNRLGS